MDWQRSRTLVAATVSLGVCLAVCTVAAHSKAGNINSWLQNTTSSGNHVWYDCTLGNGSNFVLISSATGNDNGGSPLCNPVVDDSGSTQTAACGNPVYSHAALISLHVGAPPCLFVSCSQVYASSNNSYPNAAKTSPFTIWASPDRPGNCQDVTLTANAWGN
jgi:hypothetical protein